VLVAPAVSDPGVWTFWAVTRQGGRLHLYMDGSEVAVGRWQGVFTVDAVGKSNGKYLGGRLADVALFGHALPASAIRGQFDRSG
jgi:hypothetical protein